LSIYKFSIRAQVICDIIQIFSTFSYAKHQNKN